MKPNQIYRTHSASNIKNNNKITINLIKKNKANRKYIENILCSSIDNTDNKNKLSNYYDQIVYHIELSKQKLENQLAKEVQELNEKEVQIYQILKTNLEQFKIEIMKYEEEYNEPITKSKDIEENINQNKIAEIDLYNHAFMTLEDCNSHYNELTILKEKVITKIEKLKEIEMSHPKEYKFMQEEFQLENELKTLRLKVIENKEGIKKKTQYQKEIHNEREDLLKEMVLIESQTQSIIQNQQKTKSNQYSNHNNMSQNEADNVLLKHLNKIMKVLYSKDYNENNKNMFIISLEKSIFKTKMSLMNTKKNTTDKISSLEKEIKDIRIDSNEYSNTNQHLKQLQLKNDKLNKESDLLSIYIKQFEDIFNRYSSIGTKCKDKDMNQIRLIFQNEILSPILSNHTYKTLESYNDIIKKSIITKKDDTILVNSNEEQINRINNKIDQLNKEIVSIEKEVFQLTSENSTIANKILLLNSEINQKNTNLRVNLETLGEEKFDLYIQSNESILKNMKKIYGNKVLNKVFKTQKIKLIESILNDHLTKKGKVGKSIGFIIQYNKTVSLYQTIIESLQKSYHDLNRKYEQCLEIQRTLAIEKRIMDESNKDLKENIELMLKEQIKVVKNEKQRLQNEYNTKMNIDKVDTINKKIQKLAKEKMSMINEYNSISRECNEKENKNHCNDNNYSNSYINSNSNNSKLQKKPSTALSQNNKNETLLSFSLSLSNFNDEIIKTKSHIKNDNNNIIMSVNNLSKQYLTDFHKSNYKSNSNSTSQLIAFENNSNSNSNSNNNKKLHPSNVPLIRINESNSNRIISHKNYNSIEITQSNNHNNKLKPLLNGLSLYVKFDNKILNSKYNTFNPLTSEQYPPESCGYALRYFKLNDTHNEIEIKKSAYASRSEFLIRTYTLLNVFSSKQEITNRNIICRNSLIKSNKTTQADFNKTIYIPLTLVLRDKRLNLIANNYLVFNSFVGSIRELIDNINQQSASIELIRSESIK